MIPKDATHYTVMKDGITPQMYYRYTTTKWNDGTETQTLQYYSECGSGWMNSSSTLTPAEIEQKLIPLTLNKKS